jgi:hypothetical protein
MGLRRMRRIARVPLLMPRTEASRRHLSTIQAKLLSRQMHAIGRQPRETKLILRESAITK